MSDISTATHDLKTEVTTYGVVSKSDTHRQFLALWPAAREALVVLQAIVPASVRMVISIVVNIGDALLGAAPVAAAA